MEDLQTREAWKTCVVFHRIFRVECRRHWPSIKLRCVYAPAQVVMLGECA